MPKKCVLCDNDAEYFVRSLTNDCYCKDCATSQFGDIDYLEKIEDSKEKLKEIIKNKVKDDDESEELMEEE